MCTHNNYYLLIYLLNIRIQDYSSTLNSLINCHSNFKFAEFTETINAIGIDSRFKQSRLGFQLQVT